MPSVQLICDYADRKYPNSETDANKVSDLNDIHKRIFVKIARLKNELEPFESVTIANQLTYSLPSDCSVDNIVSVKVSQSTTIDTSTEWDEYEFAGLKDDTTSGYYWGDAGNSKIALLEDDLPISTAGLSIRIFYYRSPNALSSSNMSAVPELDENYHDVLKFQLVSELASQGQSPDTEIADFWQRKADEFLAEVEKNLLKRYNKAPTVRYTTVREEWG